MRLDPHPEIGGTYVSCTCHPMGLQLPEPERAYPPEHDGETAEDVLPLIEKRIA